METTALPGSETTMMPSAGMGVPLAATTTASTKRSLTCNPDGNSAEPPHKMQKFYSKNK
jgi:hypothetical protein